MLHLTLDGGFPRASLEKGGPPPSFSPAYQRTVTNAIFSMLWRFRAMSFVSRKEIVMKNVVLGLALALAALGLMAPPVMAAPNAPQAAPAGPAADQFFLATLAVPAQAPAPALAATRP